MAFQSAQSGDAYTAFAFPSAMPAADLHRPMAGPFRPAADWSEVEGSAPARPSVREVALKHLAALNAPNAMQRSQEAGRSPTLERLSRALCAAGVGPDKLDLNAENAARLAMVARLLDIRVETASGPAPRRSVAALPKWRLLRVLDYVDANVGEPITLADLAGVAGISRMYFASQFRVATGMRPHDYLLHRRIERACDMLATTAESLVEIAFAVGFQTQAHFTTIFRKIVGETPFRWRREQCAQG